MTQEEFNQKVDDEISRLVSLMLGFFMLTHASGISGNIVAGIVTSKGFAQRITLALKQAVEKEMMRIDQEILDVGSGVRLDPSTKQRIIAGFKDKTTLREKEG